jgi:hypothetical protein
VCVFHSRILSHLALESKKPNKPDMATPRKPSDQF